MSSVSNLFLRLSVHATPDAASCALEFQVKLLWPPLRAFQSLAPYSFNHFIFICFRTLVANRARQNTCNPFLFCRFPITRKKRGWRLFRDSFFAPVRNLWSTRLLCATLRYVIGRPPLAGRISLATVHSTPLAVYGLHPRASKSK